MYLFNLLHYSSIFVYIYLDMHIRTNMVNKHLMQAHQCETIPLQSF